MKLCTILLIVGVAGNALSLAVLLGQMAEAVLSRGSWTS